VHRAATSSLPGGGFAGNHHDEVGLHQPRQHAVDSCIPASGPTSGIESNSDSSATFEVRSSLGERAADDRDQLLQVERFRRYS